MADAPFLDFSGHTIGETAPDVEVETRAEIRAASVAMARQARRRVRIVSRHLDGPVYDDPEFLLALRELATGSRSARVEILVRDSGPAVREGHRLIELARRLSTYFEFRVPSADHDAYNAAFMIVDDTATVWRNFADRFEGLVSFGDRRRAGDLGRTFVEMWESATPDPAMRRLHL
ncbi:MAG: hypothetical protein H6983_25290 [Ectothiorhodospiraceae bacterium]|nr:hypothetical protein [Ectothiorhodospiraceae bacterium]